MTPVERVARAIYFSTHVNWLTWEQLLPHEREKAFKQARAAIEAMREPNEKTIGALCVWADLSGNKNLIEHDARLIWADAIDAALQEDTEIK